MPTLKFYKITAGFVLASILVAGLFYWFQFRTHKIVIGCSKEATEKSLDWSREEGDEEDKDFATRGRYHQEDYDIYFNRCLRNNGINAPDVQ